MGTGWSLGKIPLNIFRSCAMLCWTGDVGKASKDWETLYKTIGHGSRSSFTIWAAWQFSLGRNLAWASDGGAHVSETASILDSADSKTIGGRRHLFFFFCLVRHGLGLRGRILKRFGGLWQDFFIGWDIEQGSERSCFFYGKSSWKLWAVSFTGGWICNLLQSHHTR